MRELISLCGQSIQFISRRSPFVEVYGLAKFVCDKVMADGERRSERLYRMKTDRQRFTVFILHACQRYAANMMLHMPPLRYGAAQFDIKREPFFVDFHWS